MQKEDLKNIVRDFETKGILFADGKRNKIKLFDYQGTTLNIKSFKVPIIINQIIYRYFRKSKAKRSYQNAIKLGELKILTPEPLDYIQFFDFFGLQKSYYICKHINVDYTFYDVLFSLHGEDQTFLIQQFAKFSFELHEKGIEFLDHSPGNTLIVKNGSTFDFYLVDLNRMYFHREKLNLQTRIKNLSRIASTEHVIKIISNEYCKYYKNTAVSEQLFLKMLWNKTQEFQNNFYRKKRLKNRYLFWR